MHYYIPPFSSVQVSSNIRNAPLPLGPGYRRSGQSQRDTGHGSNPGQLCSRFHSGPEGWNCPWWWSRWWRDLVLLVSTARLWQAWGLAYARGRREKWRWWPAMHRPGRSYTHTQERERERKKERKKKREQCVKKQPQVIAVFAKRTI